MKKTFICIYLFIISIFSFDVNAICNTRSFLVNQSIEISNLIEIEGNVNQKVMEYIKLQEYSFDYSFVTDYIINFSLILDVKLIMVKKKTITVNNTAIAFKSF